MDLILWRHAEAEDGQPDLDRKLTARGHKHAAQVAEWLLQRLPGRFSTLCSPAVRAVETAQALNAKLRTDVRLAPGASVEQVLQATEWPGRKGLLIVVGHQPTLGEVAARLVAGERSEWSIKKGGLWWLAHRERDGAEQVVVRAVIAPDLV